MEMPRRKMNRTMVIIIIALMAAALVSISLQRNVVAGLRVFAIDGKNDTRDVVKRSREKALPTALPMALPPPKISAEPFANRWQRRFSESESRGERGGYLFFKHTRKAGGTTLRSFFYEALEYHDQSRTFDLSQVAQAGFADGAREPLEERKGGKKLRQQYERQKMSTEWKERKRGRPKPKSGYSVNYVEQEFDAMDWQCPNIDPRWNDSLRVITLRHPVERHVSEFFFSGPGNRFRINQTVLYANRTYADELAGRIDEAFPPWMKANHAYPFKSRNPNSSQRQFGRFYTDNFQLRSVAGCSSGDCLVDYDVDDATRRGMRNQLSRLAPRDTTNCTLYYITEDRLFDACHKEPRRECPGGCDGPCFYPTYTQGPVTRDHLVRAARSLASFDAVLMMDRLDDERQADFLSDLLGVPRDAHFSLKNPKSGVNQRIQVEKNGRREKTHFYRDLLSNLGLSRLSDALRVENSLEIELFEYAEKLNEIMINRWGNETAGLNPLIGTATETNDEQTPLQSPKAASEESGTNSDSGEDDRDPTATDGEERANPAETANPTEDAHDYGVLLVMYHKTGYVLTRRLMKLTIGLEYEARGRNESEIQHAKRGYTDAVDHNDAETGARIAFSQRGNWNSNFVQARAHSIKGCHPRFKLSGGAIYLQEAPDFYCSDFDLAQRMLGLNKLVPPKKGGKTKIVHFVRNPFDMVLSNYFYHSQDPTPERWVHADDPCEVKYVDGNSLASHVLPTISPRTKITEEGLDAVVAMCRSLYRSKDSLKNATFYEHLRNLDRWDGLRLSSAQMIISSSMANKNMAGGDVLRMANNMVKFRNLLTSSSIPLEQRDSLHILTLSMDDYIMSPNNITLKFLDFVLGSGDSVVPRDTRIKALQPKTTKRNIGNHVTHGKHEDKEELRKLLRDDSVLGPILSEVEILVNEGLDQSEELMYR